MSQQFFPRGIEMPLWTLWEGPYKVLRMVLRRCLPRVSVETGVLRRVLRGGVIEGA